ncbi:hypothetical protein BURK2_02805 [Burkholderiales bacterium]|jgi:hypothetical protein|nr:hypothetical protein BURK2_02805 [Burkholderiales bacterium]
MITTRHHQYAEQVLRALGRCLAEWRDCPIAIARQLQARPMALAMGSIIRGGPMQPPDGSAP